MICVKLKLKSSSLACWRSTFRCRASLISVGRSSKSTFLSVRSSSTSVTRFERRSFNFSSVGVANNKLLSLCIERSLRCERANKFNFLSITRLGGNKLSRVYSPVFPSKTYLLIFLSISNPPIPTISGRANTRATASANNRFARDFVASPLPLPSLSPCVFHIDSALSKSFEPSALLNVIRVSFASLTLARRA